MGSSWQEGWLRGHREERAGRANIESTSHREKAQESGKAGTVGGREVPKAAGRSSGWRGSGGHQSGWGEAVTLELRGACRSSSSSAAPAKTGAQRAGSHRRLP